MSSMAANTVSRGCKRLQGALVREVLAATETVLFDCDGVIWNGETAVPGAPEVIEQLRNEGKGVFFVTNNCTRSKDQVLQKFTRLGFTGVRQDEIFSSSYCSALYLKEFAQLQGKVYVIGGQGVHGELQNADIDYVTEQNGGTLEGPVADLPLDPEIKAVLVGYDENFSFLKLAKACAYLRNPDCLFLATDPDPWHPLRGGRFTPGTGSLTAAVETAANRKATVIGKPSRFIFDCIVSRFGIESSRTLMIGDRLEADILFGTNCGIATVLTLTGVSQLEDVQAHMESDDPVHKDLVPSYYIDSIADFMPEVQD
ncbi:chronophin [Protopterus annectens]|uniref:chronophin n=1 Tax=Protopterus annectens TaxID=7888 RepID=UPI001CFC1CFC|nr:chronophin [Protopterus annectens]